MKELGIKRETFPWSNELDKILRTQPVGAPGDVELICDVSTSHSADVKLDDASGEWLINGTSGSSGFSAQTEYSIDIPSTGISIREAQPMLKSIDISDAPFLIIWVFDGR